MRARGGDTDRHISRSRADIKHSDMRCIMHMFDNRLDQQFGFRTWDQNIFIDQEHTIVKSGTPERPQLFRRILTRGGWLPASDWPRPDRLGFVMK